MLFREEGKEGLKLLNLLIATRVQKLIQEIHHHIFGAQSLLRLLCITIDLVCYEDLNPDLTELLKGQVTLWGHFTQGHGVRVSSSND